MNEKVRHVMSARQTRRHTCHWPGCNIHVPPARWGCRPHWFALPKHIRDAIWDAYVPGQEETQRPSTAYVKAAEAAQAWIAAYEEQLAAQRKIQLRTR